MKCFKNQLSKWQQDKNRQPNISQKKQQERLTERDIKELMGINRATYSRGKGGAFKQR